MAEYSVSEVSLAIRKTVEANFGMVKIRGEVGRISKPASGHIYLDLKDERSVLSGVIWKGTLQKLDTLPEEGLEVVVTGRITTFQGQSKYQVIIEKVEHAGIGALMALLEKSVSVRSDRYTTYHYVQWNLAICPNSPQVN